MYRNLILIALLLAPLACLQLPAQEFTYKEQVLIPNDWDRYHAVKVFDNDVWMMNTKITEQDQVAIINTRDSSTYRLDIPDSLTRRKFSGFDVESIRGFEIDSDGIYIACGENMLIYKKDKSYNLQHVVHTDNIERIRSDKEYIYCDNDRIVFDGVDRKNNVYAVRIHKKTFRTDTVAVGDHSVAYTFFQPRRIVLPMKGYVISLDVFNFSLDIFSYDNKKERTLSLNTEGVTKMRPRAKESSEKQRFGVNAKNIIDSLRPFVFTYSNVHSINYVNDSTIFVCWSNPPSDKKYFYEYHGSYYRISRTEVSWVKDVELGMFINYETLSANTFIGYDSGLVFENGHLILMKVFPIKMFPALEGKTKSEMDETVEKFSFENTYPPFFSYFVYKIN